MPPIEYRIFSALLLGLGGSATTVGGLGVGFRAAGLGYLGQSLVALAIGLCMLTVGLKLAATSRRTAFEEIAFRPVPVAVATPAFRWVREPVAEPARVRVHAWTGPQLALPPAR